MNDPGLLADLAYAQSRIARIMQEFGSGPEAVSAYQQAASIWEKNVRENPTDSLARSELAACLGAVANGQAHLGLHAESLHTFEQTLADPGAAGSRQSGRRRYWPSTRCGADAPMVMNKNAWASSPRRSGPSRRPC